MLRPVEFVRSAFPGRHSACDWDELLSGQRRSGPTEPFIKIAVLTLKNEVAGTPLHVFLRGSKHLDPSWNLK